MGVENPGEWATDAEVAGAERSDNELLHCALTEARAKVARGWTQGTWARDAVGERAPERGNAAVCWCIVGALNAVADDREGHHLFWVAGLLEPARDALYEALEDLGGYDFGTALVEFNDAPGRTQAEVLALFDLAIAAVEARLAPKAGAPS